VRPEESMSAQKPVLSAQERLEWLRLLRSENVGPITFYKLLERFGSAAAALEALPNLAKRGGAKRIKIASLASVRQELEEIAAAGISLVARVEENYPPLLAQVEDAPPFIFVRGFAHILKKKAVAIVGSRNASLNGVRIAQQFASDFGKLGFLVVSGLARGIDTAAHEGSLSGGTAAVVAGGVDVVYPKENQALYDSIIEQGAVISEMPLGTVPQARHFPRRNRLISGMSRGILVVEATEKSGSLITARYAADQNREVFAIPGSPLDPRSKGSNDLIRQGAHLAESAAEIAIILNDPYRPYMQEPELFDIKGKNMPSTSDNELRSARAELEKILNPAPVTVDEVIRRCQMSPAAVLTVLLELELAGRLERHPGNQVSLIGEF